MPQPLALVFAVETHLSAISLSLLTLYLLVVLRRRADWRMLGLGALVGLLTTALVWIVMARKYGAIAADLADPAERTSDTLVNLQALDYAVANTIGTRFYTLAAPGEPPRSDEVAPFLWVEAAWLAASLAGLGLYTYRSRAAPMAKWPAPSSPGRWPRRRPSPCSGRLSISTTSCH